MTSVLTYFEVFIFSFFFFFPFFLFFFVLFWQFVAPEMYVYEIPKCTDKVKWLVLLFPFHSIPLSSIPLGWGK